MILKNHGELFQRCEVNPTLTFEEVPYQAHSVEENNIILKGTGELFQRYKKNPILPAEDWPYQAHSVFNPAAAIVNGITLLLDIIGHIVKKNDSDLPIKMIYNSSSDPAAIECQKGDL